MNITFVNATRRWGGVKTWTLDVASWLREHGHNPFIVSRPGPFLDKARALNIDAMECGFGFDFNPLLVRRFMQLLRQRNTELLVANVGKDMRTAGVAAKLCKIPVVHRVGLPGDMRNMFKVRELHRWVKPAILVPCQFIKDGLLDNLPYLSPDEIKVIHTGKRPAPSPSDELRDPLHLIVTSQLNADKGHADLWQALAKLAREGHDFRCHVLGTGHEESELKLLADRLEISDKLIWHGFVTNVRDHLRKADVFVLPSRSEGLPNTLLEAMAEGLVPVSRVVGGVLEVWPEQLDFLLAGFRHEGESILEPLRRVFEAEDSDLYAWKKLAWRTCRSKFHIDTQAEKAAQWFELLAEQHRMRLSLNSKGLF
ncbi:MAG: glycosyltransferase [Desulfovibrio sp.]|uniref:glycosyltransferase n=1 Tax=Desulfovibrio sp. 7SRBS1 TaxID=3378064 RepID=UPI003B3FAB2E